LEDEYVGEVKAAVVGGNLSLSARKRFDMFALPSG
jgi:hypothetical protein